VYLTSDDISIAKKIAKTVRHSSGGLRYVKALGMLVDGRAQVSMNLTNFRKTPIALVVETIRREAQRYGTAIHHSELVGLIPQDALVDAAVWYTQLDQFEPEQILERRLYAAGGGTQEAEKTSETVDTPLSSIGNPLLKALADASPTPGGGSAAAYAGAMGAALVSMVAGLTLGKKKYTEVQPQMEAVISEAESLRAQFALAVQKDADAFARVMDAFRLPKQTENEKNTRKQAVREAMQYAAEIPLATAEKAVRVIELAAQAAELGNANAITDAGTGAALAQAALTGAAYNVRINALDLNKDNAEILLTRLAELEKQAEKAQKRVQSALRERGNLQI
ncbi:MAG TPA: hypothetical protein EYP88_07085, partial [Anaerolineales bacterium]|nr:hypothetical protein [Anaerolineales bacterium]